jgi:hypothetical protein
MLRLLTRLPFWLSPNGTRNEPMIDLAISS